MQTLRKLSLRRTSPAALTMGLALIVAATVFAAVSRDPDWNKRVSSDNLRPIKIVALKDIGSHEWTPTSLGDCYLTTFGKTIKAGTVLSHLEVEDPAMGTTDSGTVFTSKILGGTPSGYVILACQNKDHDVPADQYVQNFGSYFAFTFAR